ncbi:hypothetical protein [Pseudomonas frederiksbergensis]|uniref:hypothetical protein n=1 Tax=Pseudomonas frederiksbergensis TaxID=104087 RepID=UPI003D1F5431
MQTQDNVSESSANGRQKQAIITAINNFLADETITDLGWSWERIAVTSVPGTDFDQVHRSASVYLSILTRHPDFLKIRTSQSIPAHAVYLVDESGRLYYSWPNVSTYNDLTTAFFSPKDITSLVTGIATVNGELKLLANMAKLSGGWITTGNKIVVSQWLRFHDLSLPATEQDAKGLIDLLNFMILPEPPRFGNYWQLLDTPEDSPFRLTENNRAIIRKVNHSSSGGKTTLVAHLGKHLPVEIKSAGLPTSPEYRLQRLIEITVGASEQGQAYFDALGWFTDTTQPKPSPVLIEQLLIAAMLLDLDPALDSANTTFAGFNLYSAEYLLLQPSAVRKRLEDHLYDRFALDRTFAPLVAELVLGGMAPEYLVRGVPAELQLGTPGWVVLSQAVHLVESLVPGASRAMSYEHLLGFGQVSGLTPQLQALHTTQAVDPIITWALMNGLITREADGSLGQAAVKRGVEQYNQYVGALSGAISQISQPIPSRKALALKELRSIVPDSVSSERLVKHRGSGGGAGRQVSVLDLYIGEELHTQDWGRTRGANIYQQYPGLTALYPVANLYEEAIHNHYNQMTAGLAVNIKYAFSQMEEGHRKFIEQGRLAIYQINKIKYYTNYRPSAGNVITTPPQQTKPEEDAARHGLIIFAVIGPLIRCYELFPMRLECRFRQDFSTTVASKLISHWIDENYSERELLLKAPIDLDAYVKNIAPRDGIHSDVYLTRIADLEESGHPTQSTNPIRYFNSERLDTISHLVARNTPIFTEKELTQIGLDQTERERAIEKTDAVFNVILNLIIPFKECVEELSSGVAERQRNALFGCVTDVLVVAVAFAAIPLKVAGTAAKGASLTSKLLTASRVGAQTVVSLFNPLDGIPQLLKGGAKLIGRGALKVGHFAASSAHVARQQLRYLTGANSYDLIRAINHTGAASQIRMSLDTVAHARALFRSDSITTIEQVVTRLSDKKLPWPKNADPAELQQLFNRAAKEAALQNPQVRHLGSLIGQAALDDVLTTYMANKPISYTNTLHSAQSYSDTLSIVAELETKKVTYMKNYQENVLKLDLGKAPYNDVMPESLFNPQGYTDPALRAGAWMLNGSTSNNDFDAIVSVLREYASSNKSLTDPGVIKELHSRLVPDLAGSIREAGAPTKYGSSITGFALMEQHLKTLNSAHPHFDKHLLATVVGFQGFGDGNGRTASALFAISQLRTGQFKPMPKEVFNLLSGMA